MPTLAIAGTRGHHAALLSEVARLPQFRVTALHAASDPIHPLTTWCAQYQHPAEIYDDYESMLDRARPDVVVVCGPFELHASMCVAAIRRGVHVITEKPAAITFDDLASLRRACAYHPNVHLAGMMFSRYAPGFATARHLIEQGAIGQIRLINTRKSYKLGTRPPYYQDRSTYGGTIPWVGSHAIDWILHLTNNLPFKRVYAAHSSAHNNDNGTLERTALCHFTLADDIFASATVDYCRPSASPTHGDDWARVVGTHGVMEIRADSLKLTTESNGPTSVPVSSGRTFLADVLDHIEGRSRAWIEAASTLALTDACLRARQSADEGQAIAFGLSATTGS